MNTYLQPHPDTSPSPGAADPPDPVDPAAVARALYAALADRAIEVAAHLLDPEVVLHVPGTHDLAGTHRGLESLLAFMTATTAATDDGETIEPLEVLAGPEHVAVRCRVTASRGRRRLDNSTIHLLRIRGGRVCEIHLHNFDGPAVDAFWS